MDEMDYILIFTGAIAVGYVLDFSFSAYFQLLCGAIGVRAHLTLDPGAFHPSSVGLGLRLPGSLSAPAGRSIVSQQNWFFSVSAVVAIGRFLQLRALYTLSLDLMSSIFC